MVNLKKKKRKHNASTRKLAKDKKIRRNKKKRKSVKKKKQSKTRLQVNKNRRSKKRRKKSKNAGMTFTELMNAVNERTSNHVMDLSGLGINNKQLSELINHSLLIFKEKNVFSLNLSHNNITDIESIALLDMYVDLESLDLSNQAPSDKNMSLVPLEDMIALQVLSISNANVVDIEPLRNLDNLKVLYYSGNDIQDHEPISQLNLLTEEEVWQDTPTPILTMTPADFYTPPPSPSLPSPSLPLPSSPSLSPPSPPQNWI